MSALLAGCAQLFPTTYRFRMTVAVDTPQGLRTGSSVMEISVKEASWRIADSARAGVHLKGQAVAVDLPLGRTLFALLTDEGRGEIMTGVTRALYPGFVGGADHFIEAAPKLAAMRNGPPREMAREDYPLLVTFADIRDPTSVARVDPEDLAATFGSGMRLRRISVAVTDEAISTGIDERLGWLGSYRNKTFAGNRFAIEPTLSDSLMAGAFTTESVQ
ncbi:hypothetical protein FBR43_06820 [Sphingomonas baiyangensis]|uniref:Uncharacterized protein n=2 Tax=Sphingomonas baiyangensis TaxID=2572576 RepID=A0A4V5PWC2_9SPHN|nr:hypothetical protein FBR43_06820 [Sphingomonas baiyangensis]